MAYDRIRFRGIMPALVSPVDGDGEVRERALRELVRWQMGWGVHGFYALGSTGEGLHMTAPARERFLEVLTDEVAGKLPVIVHIGAIDMPSTLALARHAATHGADAVSSVPPIFFGYREEEIVDYYRAIADAAGLPVLIYAIPNAGNALKRSVIERLMREQHIIGLKWTYPNYDELERIKRIDGGNINVINGPDESLLAGLAMGADGGIGSTYNLMPALFVRLYDAVQAGDLKEALRQQRAINRVIDALLAVGVIGGVKALLDDLGFGIGDPLPPFQPVCGEALERLRAATAGVDFRAQAI